jgi:hypothetical protein
MDENKIREIIEDVLSRKFGSQSFILPTHMQFMDGRNIRTGRATGTKIGTAIDQKIGFFGKAPVVQRVAPTTLGNVISVLQDLGLTA